MFIMYKLPGFRYSLPAQIDQDRRAPAIRQCSWLSCWLGNALEIPKQPRLMLGQRVAFWKLMVRRGQGTLLRTTSTQFIEHREANLIPVWSTHLYVLVSLMCESTLQATKREALTLTHSQNLQPTICPACKTCWAMEVQNLLEWPTNDWFNLKFMKVHMPDNAWIGRNCRAKHDWQKIQWNDF